MALGDPYELGSSQPKQFSAGDNPVQPTQAPQKDPTDMLQRFMQMQHMFSAPGGGIGGAPGGGTLGGLGSGISSGMNTGMNLLSLKKLLSGGGGGPQDLIPGGFVDAPAMIP